MPKNSQKTIFEQKETKLKISVIVLTLDEEKNIERCLLSVMDIADDIVVVDSYSTDRTKEICKKYNVRFLEHPFEGFIEQKNWAVSQAKYSHILSIEGDEALSEELKKSIIAVKKKWAHDAYYFNRFSNYCGKWIKHSGWYPDKKLRLWDSRKGRFGGLNPHDKLILEQGATKKFLKGDLLHSAFFTISEHMNLANKYSNIKAENAFASGQTANWFDILFAPLVKFVRGYFFKLGFLDGFYGFVINIIGAQSKFLKYARLKQLNKK